MCASESKLFKTLKNGIDILVGQADFKLWIKTVKINYIHTVKWGNFGQFS